MAFVFTSSSTVTSHLPDSSSATSLSATRRRHRAPSPASSPDSEDGIPSWHHHSQLSSNKRQKLDSSSSSAAITTDRCRSSWQFVASPEGVSPTPSPPSINIITNNLLPTPESTPPSSASPPSEANSASSSSVNGSVVANGGNDETVPAPASAAAQKAQFCNAVNAQKDKFVAGLVGASVIALESIWGRQSTNSTTCPASKDESSVLPLHYFIKEVLRRSRTSCSTLQVALYYLHKSRREIRAAIARCAVEAKAKKEKEDRDGYPSPPLTPRETLEDLLGKRKSELENEVDAASPVLCGRRIFLSALITASKFLQDKNYSNRAWAKISGLSPREITRNERCFLGILNWECYVGASEFDRWTERLSTLACTTLSHQNPAALASNSSSLPIARPNACARTALALASKGIARSETEYPPLPTTSIVEQHIGRPIVARAPSASDALSSQHANAFFQS